MVKGILDLFRKKPAEVAAQVPSNLEPAKMVGEKWIKTKETSTKYFGKEICQLGSAYSIAIALIVFGLLNGFNILPFGLAGVHSMELGCTIFIIQTFIHYLGKQKAVAAPQEIV